MPVGRELKPGSRVAQAVVIGAGPAGLMAAEVLALAGVRVEVFDAMPSVGRKFLLAGRGGLNLTHAESAETFVTRYAEREDHVKRLLDGFGANELRSWVHGLGIETFIGTSQRVFPKEMKAAPLLRAWLHRLRSLGVHFNVRHRWLGWDKGGELCFSTSSNEPVPLRWKADVCVLALGGASWSKLGSDGAWAPYLQNQGVQLAPFRPANCGFDVASGWSEHLRKNFAGQPIKPVALSFTDSRGQAFSRQGEFVLTDTGIEGSLVYAASALLREEIASKGRATLTLDLLPDKTPSQIERATTSARGSRSLSNHLRAKLGLQGLKVALLYELLEKPLLADPLGLAKALKSLPISLGSARPIDEAISSAGGVRFESMDEHLMLTCVPGVFCAGEMLDWEAPTGGYLLTACFASGHRAGLGALRWLELSHPEKRGRQPRS
jgi:uncharacterized flavoprotein (TIGR03862 family)